METDLFLQQVQQTPATLLLDYDGTLAPFTKQRDEAFPLEGMQPLLEQLACHHRLVIVTGRTPEEILRFLPTHPPLEVFGNHGIVYQDAQKKLYPPNLPPHFLDDLHALEELTREALDAFPEQIERKPFSLAVHFRDHPQAQQHITHILLPLWQNHLGANLEIHPFNGGYEIRGKNFGKHLAIEQILSQTDPHTPICYIGDDLTDEDAFEALGSRGYKILISKTARKTHADTRLASIEELKHFLQKWLNVLTFRT